MRKKKQEIKKKETVLVTGAGGYIGSVLTEKVLQEGYDVHIVDRFFFGRKPISHLKNSLTIHNKDIRDVDEHLLKGVSTIFHLAGLSNDPTAEFNPKANHQINTLGSIALARRARNAGVKKFIFASSCSIYDLGIDEGKKLKTERSHVSPTAAYSLSKYLAERELFKLANKNFVVAALRTGTVSGFSKRMRYDLVINSMVKDAVSRGKIQVFSRGEQWRPIIDIQDVVEAYLLVMNSPEQLINKQVFNIALGNYQVIDLATIVQKSLQKYFGIGSSVIVTDEKKNSRSYRVSTEKAKRVLHFTPKVSVEKSVISMYRDIKKNGLTNYSSPRYYNIRWMKNILRDL